MSTKTSTNSAKKTTTNTKSASAPVKTATVPANTETAAPAPVAVVNTNTNAAEAVSEDNAIIGTPEQLVQRGVLLNGRAMGLPDFSHLRKFHFKTAIDSHSYVAKPKGIKGKPAEIVKLLQAPGFSYSFQA